MTSPNTSLAASRNAPSRPLLELKNVTAYYRDLQALFGVTLKVNEGEIVTLIGANGAGKTTTLRVISGMKQLAAGYSAFWRTGRLSRARA